jgi:hypothetical protein
MLAVDCLGENLGNCCFAGAAGSAEQIAVPDSPGADLIFQCPYDRITTADVVKRLRPVFAV